MVLYREKLSSFVCFGTELIRLNTLGLNTLVLSLFVLNTLGPEPIRLEYAQLRVYSQKTLLQIRSVDQIRSVEYARELI